MQNRVMVMLTPEELERLGHSAPEGEDNRTREEKMSEFARTRERDDAGRFLSKRDREMAELEAYYYSPHRVVYKPLRNGPSHVLIRTEELYWHQKAYVWFAYGLAGIGVYGILIGVWEGVKAVLLR